MYSGIILEVKSTDKGRKIMANASDQNEDLPHEHQDKGTSRGIIWAFIVIGLFFVLLFIYLTSNYFLPVNSEQGNSNSQSRQANS